MKKQEHKQIISIDQFDEEISLYQLLSPGAGRGLTHLKTIVNSILHNPEQEQRKPLSLLIVGKQGARTHGRSFIRALGLESINEIHALLLHASHNAIHEFFNPLLPPQSFLISSIDTLYSSILKTLYEIVSTGKYAGYDYQRGCKEVVAIHAPVVLTAHKQEKIPKYFQEGIDHIVRLEEYSEDQLELIVLQRLKYCGIDYEDEKVLSLIVDYGHSNLQNIIRLLKNSITLMLAGNRSVLTAGDVNKGRKISILRVSPPPPPQIPF